jgi:hypothetical protein
MASDWQLPEDGIIDPVAVRRAVDGEPPPVRLTRTEQLIAAAILAARGCPPSDIATRLHMHLPHAVKVIDCVKRAA